MCRSLDSSPQGLSSNDAQRRLRLHGPNELRAHQGLSALRILKAQVDSPLLLILLFAAAVSALSGEWRAAVVVGLIVLVTVIIGYRREYSAEAAVAALRARLRTRAAVLRDAWSCRCRRLFLGTNVQTGMARAVVVQTGSRTEFGAIARRLTLRPPETQFERSTRRFGYLLTSAMLLMVLVAADVVRGRPPLETLLFATALAVGLSPELLPAILGVNLSRGAQSMAERGVLVRQLNAIDNLGSMLTEL